MAKVVVVMKALVLFMILGCYISAQRIRYISTERPTIEYINPKYLKYVNFTSQRYGRGDPFYYVGLHFDATVKLDNNILVDFYFLELQLNQYRRSFLEMHFRWCDLILKDKFFGTTMRQGKLNQSCPFPSGEYHLYNMSIPFDQIPKSFPFKKGRIWANTSIIKATGPNHQDVELVGSGHIDMEVKVYNKKTKNVLQ